MEEVVSIMAYTAIMSKSEANTYPDRLEECIDFDELNQHCSKKTLDGLSSFVFGRNRMKKLQILGSGENELLNGKTAGYANRDGSWVVIINPPESYRFDQTLNYYQLLKKLDIQFTAYKNLFLPFTGSVTELCLANNRFIQKVVHWNAYKKLERLDIHNSVIENVEELLCSFPTIKYLNASNVKFENISFLNMLTNLEELILAGSEISNFRSLTQLRRLKRLDLTKAELPAVIEADFPPDVQYISLADSSVRWVPEKLGTLKKLKKLDLSGLELEKLPDWFAETDLNFYRDDCETGICLKNTKIKGVDMSVFERDDQEYIHRWLKNQRDKDLLVPVNEMKVVFLGEAGDAASDFVRRYLDAATTPDPTMENGTAGSIPTYSYEYERDGKRIRIQFWNLCVQSDVYSAYRMFTSERTIFAVMVSADESTEEKIRRRLDSLKGISGRNSVMLVLHQADRSTSGRLDHQALLKCYPELCRTVTLHSGEDSSAQMRARLTTAIQSTVHKYLDDNMEVLQSWNRLRLQLREQKKPYILRNEFDELAEQCGVEKSQEIRETLLKTFENLGIVVRYSGNTQLENRIVIRPEWLVHAFYTILSPGTAPNENGVIAHDTISDLLTHRKKRKTSATSGDMEVCEDWDVMYILQVMRQLRLSFEVSEGYEFVPYLCQNKPAAVREQYVQNPNALGLRLKYDFVPRDLLHSLMVEMKQDLDIGQTWREGAHLVSREYGVEVLMEIRRNSLDIYCVGDTSERRDWYYLNVLQSAADRISRDLGLRLWERKVRYQGEWMHYDAVLLILQQGEQHNNSTTDPTCAEITIGQPDDLLVQEQARLKQSFTAACQSLQKNYLSKTMDRVCCDQNLCESLANVGYAIQHDAVANQIRILRGEKQVWSKCKTVTIRDASEQQQNEWSNHMNQLLNEYTSGGLPTLFLVSYVTCTAEAFDQIRKTYLACMRNYKHNSGAWRAASCITEPVVSERRDSMYLDRCSFLNNDETVTVYHFFIRLGQEKVLEKKRAEILQLPTQEYKVVFLGDSEAGKSLTAARFENPDMDPANYDVDVTRGVDIKYRHVLAKDGRRNVRVNIWDFGGQQILHSMHRMFLSERTMCVILLNARNDNQDERARFWLRHVMRFAPEAPVMLVINKIDQNRNASINERALKREFGNIREVLKISAKKWSKQEFEDGFIKVIESQIREEETQESEFTGLELQMIEWLRGTEKPRIRLDELKAEYKRIEDKSSQSIDEYRHEALTERYWKGFLQRLNENGVCVFFSNPTEINRQVLLKPDWITDAISMIIVNFHSAVENGVIAHDTIDLLYEGHVTDKNGTPIKVIQESKQVFSPDDTSYVLNVMREFKLSFKCQMGHEEFIPMLCTRDEPEAAEPYICGKNTLEYHLMFLRLPDEVLYRLMMDRYLELDKENVWKMGAIFTAPSGVSAAVVQESDALKLYVNCGQDVNAAKSYADNLMGDIDRISAEYKSGILERRMVYKYNDKRATYDYDQLRASDKYGLTHVVSCAHGQVISVKDVLDQTNRWEENIRKTLIENIWEACCSVQRTSADRKEVHRNKTMYEWLRGQYDNVDYEPVLGYSATGETAGRPDIVVRDVVYGTDVIIEALNILENNKKIEDWKEHFVRLTENYNVAGNKVLVLVSYLDCDESEFARLSRKYQELLSKTKLKKYNVHPSVFQMLDFQERSAKIYVARVDYDCGGGYRPSVYHFVVHMHDKPPVSKPAKPKAPAKQKKKE